MLLSSVILVLREVLEAALLFSLLMALSIRLGISLRWVLVALIAGALGAAICGFNIDRISEFYDGVGQELLNAALQLGIFVLLCGVGVTAVLRVRGFAVPPALLPVLMATCVILAVTREGSEVMIYLSGFLQMSDQWAAVLTGSFIGAGIGVSVGAVFYFAMLTLQPRLAAIVGAALLALVAAGMTLQATELLIQADWLPADYPVWDSSAILSEQSVAGQLLYALVGYEATPTALQVGAYVTAVLVILGAALLAARWQAADRAQMHVRAD
jgi:high-affinity iron transporter